MWTVILVVICSLSCCPTSAERLLQKRIVFGAVLGGRLNTDYEATKWFVWIGKGVLVGYETSDQDWNARNEKCGGVLLTPNTVQTACSCMTRGWLGRREGDWNYPEWDGERVDIVVGRGRVDPSVKTIPMVKWHFHPLCRKTSGQKHDWVSHDYMLLGSTTVLVDNANKKVKLAPVYMLQTMLNAWYRISSKNLVCLMIGMGQYKDGSNARSNMTWHGWNQVADYNDCKNYYAKDVTQFSGSISDYQTFNTWSCLSVFHYRPRTENFSQIAHAGAGDWGSPVSCDNIFFGLLNKEFVSTIVFNAYHNAYEFRAEMQKEFDKFYIEPRDRSISMWSRYVTFKHPTMKHDYFEIKPEDLSPALSPPQTYFRMLLAGTGLKNAQAKNNFDVRPIYSLLMMLLSA